MKVSIITPHYEASKHEWERTIESIHAQTSKDFEWVLVQDGGNAYHIDFGLNIKDVLLCNNYGPSVARNVGFQVSDGDIITYVDVGDTLDMRRVEVIRRAFEVGDLDLLFAPYTIIEDGKRYLYHPRGFASRYTSLKAALKIQNIIIPLGVAHTRRPFVEAGGFQPGIVCGEDGLLWRRMLEYGNLTGVEICNSLAGEYYVNNTGQSRTQRRFDMGGFAFDAEHPDGRHGQYLDDTWYKKFHSRDLYD